MTEDTSTEIPRATVEIGPEAIVDYELGREKKGYDRILVDELLDRLAAQTAALVSEVNALRGDRGRLLARLEDTSETESTLKRTLITAQRAAESSVQQAQEQADAIRARALERAESLLAKAADEAHEMRQTTLRRARADEAEARRRRRVLDEHVASLRAFAEDHRERVAHHLRQQLERLDALQLPEPPPVPSAVEDLAEGRFDEFGHLGGLEGLDEDDLGALDLSGDDRSDAEAARRPEAMPPSGTAPGRVAAPPPRVPPGDGSPDAGPTDADASPEDDLFDVPVVPLGDVEVPDFELPEPQEVDLDELLSRVDEAAAEVEGTAEAVERTDVPAGVDVDQSGADIWREGDWGGSDSDASEDDD